MLIYLEGVDAAVLVENHCRYLCIMSGCSLEPLHIRSRPTNDN
jgi:hypothetical protein